MTDSGPSTPDAMTDLSLVDRRQVTAAYGKLLRNEPLARGEQAALARFEKQREERLRWQYYRSIPKKHWQKMSGRQVKVINEQAARYELPMDGPTIDLPKLVMALHDFLAKNAQRLAQEDEPLLRSAGMSPALERYREERARLAQLDRLERERELVPVREALVVVERAAGRLRTVVEALARQYGNEVATIFCDALDECQRMLREEWGDAAPAAELEAGL